MRPGLPRSPRDFCIRFSQLAFLTCVMVGSALACQSAEPATPTVPPLTAPAPATPTPTPTATVGSQAMLSTPSTTPTATTLSTPTMMPTATAVPSGVSLAVVARTAEKTADLTDRMLQPRQVDADFLWGMFITNKSFVGGWATPNSHYAAQMLQMWHPENPCYSELAEEVAKLGAANDLLPLEFLLYLNHVTAQLAPCIERQLPLVDPDSFFEHSTEVRTQRITLWFDRTWQDANDSAFPFDAGCRPEFFSHLPDAIVATDSLHLESAWVSAMVVVSGCARDATSDYFAFLNTTESRLFELQPDDRYTTVSLQMTMFGHLLSIHSGKPRDECWPDYESRIPDAASSDNPQQLSASKDAAFQVLQDCLEALPATNPFAKE